MHKIQMICCLLACMVGCGFGGMNSNSSASIAPVTNTTSTEQAAAPSNTTRSAIFLHPDGMGANTWAATRLVQAGPDGQLAWDRLPRVAVYVGPLSDRAHASSNGGATTHAYGIRAAYDSYGMIDDKAPPIAASGKAMSLMREAQVAGKAVAILNTASLTEPGTGAFLASVPDRDRHDAIAAQILAARPDIMLGGGERYFLPIKIRGRHGMGARNDGRNLIDEARAAGYTVVFTRDELDALPATATRVLGLFAHDATYQLGDDTASVPWRFQPQAPRFDTMLAFAMSRLKNAPNGYFIVGNEEATDDFASEQNASAVLDAAKGADRAIGLALNESARTPSLTVLVASDSDSGGMFAVGNRDHFLADLRADHDPKDRYFLAAANAQGQRLPFRIGWAASSDGAGGLVARGVGPGAAKIEGTIDSTAIYRALYLGLFDRSID
jgi:alkaline phosphatase